MITGTSTTLSMNCTCGPPLSSELSGPWGPVFVPLLEHRPPCQYTALAVPQRFSAQSEWWEPVSASRQVHRPPCQCTALAELPRFSAPSGLWEPGVASLLGHRRLGQ